MRIACRTSRDRAIPAVQKARTGYGITVSISVAGISFDMQWAAPTG